MHCTPRPHVSALLALIALCHAGLAGAEPSAGELAVAANRLEQSLIAPCCFHHTIAEHRSPESDAVRADIRSRLRSGESEASILASYEQRYGERILAAPHLAGFGLLAWIPPGAGLLAAAVLVWRWMRMHRRRDEPRSGGPPDGALDARLAAELARFDA